MEIAGYKLRINGGDKKAEIIDIGSDLCIRSLTTLNLDPRFRYTIDVAEYDNSDPLITSEWFPFTKTSRNAAVIRRCKGAASKLYNLAGVQNVTKAARLKSKCRL